MALAPINYTSQVINPLQAMIGGIGQAQQLQQNDQQMEMQRRVMAMQEQRAGAGVDPETSRQMFADLSDALASGGDPSKLLARYPMLSEQILESWKTLDSVRQQSAARSLGQVHAMLDSGNVDMAMEAVDRRIAAAERSGDTRELQELRVYKRLIQSDPEKAKNYFRMVGSVIAPDMFPGTDTKVGAQEILPDGTIIQSTPQGPVVFGPDGARLEGQAAANAIRRAREFGVEVATETSRGREVGKLGGQADLGAAAEGAKVAGKQGQELALGAFDAAARARANISNLDEAIAALDAGANTGVIESMFPNWKASTIELENVRNRLGLDVVGSVTFGALSEGELGLALSTALPTTLSPPQLKDWLQRKKESQSKLINYLEEQARFLSKPGNTLNDWLEKVNGQSSPKGDAPKPGRQAVPSYFEKYAPQGGR